LAVVFALSASAGCAQRAAEPAAPGYSAPPPGGTNGLDEKPQPQPGYGQAPSSTTSPTTTLDGEKKKAELRPAEQQQFARVEDAEAELERARAELEALGIESRKQPKGSSAQPAAASRPADETPPKPSPKAATPESRCESACKALISLKRAADGVCRLAGDSDARCTRAREIVKSSETRLAMCKCEEKTE